MDNKSITLVYPLAVGLSFKIIGSVHDFFSAGRYIYKDGECLLKMVNDSNPEHFIKHPLWVYRGFTSDCDTRDYFNIQQENKYEFMFTYFWIFGGAVLGLLSLLFTKFPKNFTSYVPLSFIATAMVLISAHYMQDNTYLCGNIQHHTNYKDNEGENASGRNSVPHGVSNGMVFAQAMVMLFVNNILKKHNKKLNFTDFAKVYLPIQAFWLVWR